MNTSLPGVQRIDQIFFPNMTDLILWFCAGRDGVIRNRRTLYLTLKYHTRYELTIRQLRRPKKI
ncbi:hypothetical protein SPRG_07204 [Saprolegnia parasitica CBS 223.65]|uniref:Uncharacterized protein n=1 Tax=Saprolegnia parasitica (strain CBS 223.65) TaxID=695850 RepID=A0A067CFG7_SAPPC|nr:hypothetical protein SPRG_07204 [Saprolegnia parasitica CBS 223.65]KDO27930.1 hypothetical protein SPRG_07204 [Saprolegnia parasitica CBS 223.65]|eukprot:XP_012201386.1 hypothetical protein SPRG_07204 [Saprolegnia parasitica CBS 223.65]